MGFRFALQKLGMPHEVVGVDIDRQACITFQRNHVGQAIIADARFSPIRMETGFFDVVIGCPPCQGFTRMRGKPKPDDHRNALVLTFLEWIKKLRPRYVMFENVPWIWGSNYCKKLEKGLRSLGYMIVSGVLNAADFGVPQRRKRYVMVASIRHRPKLPKPTHARPAIAKKLGREPWATVRQAIEKLPSLTHGASDPIVPNHRAMKHSKLVLERIRFIPKDGGSRFSLPARLQLTCHKKNNGYNDVYGRMRWDAIAPTLTCGCTNPTKGRFLHPEQNRGITPREAARLQTFPDWFIFFGSFTSITKQVGNAMPVEFAKCIAYAIFST